MLHANMLNVLRLVLAVLVVFSHSFPLTRGNNTTEPLSILSQGATTFGSMAVNAFFAISGFLIIRSYLGAPSLDAYFRRRVLRVYPGYIAALTFSAILAAFTVNDALLYVRSLAGRDSVLYVLSMTYGPLDTPGIFAGNPHPGANGSLWTIQYEFLAYCVVAAYGLFKLFRYRVLWLCIVGAMLLLYGRSSARGIDDHLLRFGVYFAVGATAHLFREKIVRSWIVAALALLLLLASLRLSPWISVLTPAAATYLLLYLGTLPVPGRLAWTRNTDISYGVYLYAFPIQQSLVYWLDIREPMVLFPVALSLTVVCGLVSWKLIEKPALLFKHAPESTTLDSAVQAVQSGTPAFPEGAPINASWTQPTVTYGTVGDHTRSKSPAAAE